MATVAENEKSPWRVGQLPERVAGYPEGMTKGSCRFRNLGSER